MKLFPYVCTATWLQNVGAIFNGGATDSTGLQAFHKKNGHARYSVKSLCTFLVDASASNSSASIAQAAFDYHAVTEGITFSPMVEALEVA